MTDYNFAKNYENIKDWEFKNQSVSDTFGENYLDQILNLIKSSTLYFFIASSPVSSHDISVR